MKIYSWNVLCYNKKFSEVCNYIETLDFDVLCLQELTPEMLACIKKFPFKLVYHIDVIRLYSKEHIEHNYVAILSKHEIVGQGTFKFPEFTFPGYTRLFIRSMKAMKFSFLSDRGAMYIDVLVNGKKIRIFSVHLTLWGPSRRVDEFNILTNHMDPSTPTVIAGDFNVIEYPPMKILNFLLGAPIRESLPNYPERELIESLFAKHGFKNPLKGQSTHDFSRSQLDHILVPQYINVLNTRVVADLHGSDHHPVCVEIEV